MRSGSGAISSVGREVTLDQVPVGTRSLETIQRAIQTELTTFNACLGLPVKESRGLISIINPVDGNSSNQSRLC